MFRWNSTLIGKQIEAEIFHAKELTSFTALLEAIGTDNRAILITNETVVRTTTTSSVTITVPANVELIFTRNGYLNVNSNITLNINGIVSAGEYQIFKGAGTVKISHNSVPMVLPHWWGAKFDGTTDDITALTKARASILAGSGLMLRPSAGSAAGSGPIIEVIGTGSNHALTFSTKGTSALGFRRIASSGTALVNGDFTHAGWGTGATLVVDAGSTDQKGSFTVTAGTAGAGNPTVTLTFKDGAWSAAPIAITKQFGGTAALADTTEVTTTTTLVITYKIGVAPTNTQTHKFSYIIVG